MVNTKSQIADYFDQTLALDVAPRLWQPARRLPLFLRAEYTFYEVQLLKNRCLLMADKKTDKAAATIRKHLDRVQQKWDGDLIIYVREQLKSDQRRRLIEAQIPFLAPGNQMYLPMLGVDLREHFRQIRDAPDALSPATQAVVLHLLIDHVHTEHTATELAKCLGYSPMTMTRAFDELEMQQLCDVRKTDRKRSLRIKATRKDLWSHALSLMQSPFKQRQCIRASTDQAIGLVAGLSALANYSMLAPPKTPVVAFSSAQWNDIRRGKGQQSLTADDPDAVEVEVWQYDPRILSDDKKCVDRFSLFLSLKDTQDERVEAALDQMMEGVAWS